MSARLLLTQEERAAIGDVAIQSAMLEMNMEMFIRDLTKFDQNMADIFVGRMMFEGKHGILKNLIHLRLKKETKRNIKRRKEFDLLMARMSQLNADRVTTIHGYWGFKEGGPFVSLAGMLLDPSKWKRPPVEVVHFRKGTSLSMKKVMDLAKDLLQANAQLLHFWGNTFPTRKKRTKPKAP
jgi:hypothetical protein